MQLRNTIENSLLKRSLLYLYYLYSATYFTFVTLWSMMNIMLGTYASYNDILNSLKLVCITNIWLLCNIVVMYSYILCIIIAFCLFMGTAESTPLNYIFFDILILQDLILKLSCTLPRYYAHVFHKFLYITKMRHLSFINRYTDNNLIKILIAIIVEIQMAQKISHIHL